MSLRKPGMTAKLHKLSSTSLFCGGKINRLSPNFQIFLAQF